MKDFLLVMLMVISYQVCADTLSKADLVGNWEPSGAFPSPDDLTLYEFKILPSGDGVYKSIGEKGYSLSCKPKSSSGDIYVYHCFTAGGDHIITLSLSGWSKQNNAETNYRAKKLMYGYEYWIHPNMNGVYGGVPVSFKPKTLMTSKGSE